MNPNCLLPYGEYIIKLGPVLATLDDAVAFCEHMAHSNPHRSLAVLGAYFLHGRERDAAMMAALGFACATVMIPIVMERRQCGMPRSFHQQGSKATVLPTKRPARFLRLAGKA